MTRPPLSVGSRLRFKSSHCRFGLKTSHRRPGETAGALEPDEDRERYIAPPRKFRR